MPLINRTIQLLVATCFILPFSAYADSWSCSKNDHVREVYIEQTTSEPVPCNVVYKKQTEGVEDLILWNANNDESYCDEKAEAFIAKLESWGWVCAETVSDDTADTMEATEEMAEETTEAADTMEATETMEEAAETTDATQ